MVSKVWETMNELEMVTSKICSAREIIDAAIDRIQEHQYDKAETMMSAAHEFLGYYLDDFDKKFKDAWQETVVKQREQEEDPCMPPWGHSDMEYLIANSKQDKVVKWQLPIEEKNDYITGETEYFITFPDDLLEAANIKEGDSIEWVDNEDGSYILKKVPQTYDEKVSTGYTMTADDC
jgi:hypothetical protein